MLTNMSQGMINKLVSVLEATLSKLSRYDEGSLIGSILSFTVSLCNLSIFLGLYKVCPKKTRLECRAPCGMIYWTCMVHHQKEYASNEIINEMLSYSGFRRSLKVYPHYAVRQNATKCGLALRQMARIMWTLMRCGWGRALACHVAWKFDWQNVGLIKGLPCGIWWVSGFKMASAS